MVYLFKPTPHLQWSLVSLEGPDVLDFLQRLSTVNVKALKSNQEAPGCFLSATGKIQAFFWLWPVLEGSGSQYIIFEFDAGPDGIWKEKLLGFIEQYTFAEKMKLKIPEKGSLECCWIFVEKEEFQWASLPDVHIFSHGDRDYGISWFSVWGEPQALALWKEKNFMTAQKQAQAQEISFEKIEEWRITHLTPRVGYEITESTNPLEIGLKRAVSENKGCYPGQEVIEKIVALGSPSRRLVLIQGVGDAPVRGQKIDVGEVTSSLSQDGKFSVLAFVGKISAKEGSQVKLSSGKEAMIVRVASYEI